MPIKTHMLSLGALQTNCYILADEETRSAVIIDPSDEAEAILQVVSRENYIVREILITHGHFDHVLASGKVKEKTGAPVRIHRADVPMLEHAQHIARTYGLPADPPPTPDYFIEVGEVFQIDSIRLETLFTPGHSPGHVSFVLPSEKMVFSGDCLFKEGIGRTDLPGGDYKTLMTSIMDLLLPLGDDYQVCSGHGPITTIGLERRFNPFIAEWVRHYGQ
jgi:glyoxylase-like metal-dependent hydrolase (beta-lactamase superfamily II)